MIKIGEYNTLEILRDTDPGLFLGDEEGNEVLLPNRYVPEAFEIGENLEVFVYLDNDERPVAVTDKPYIISFSPSPILAPRILPRGLSTSMGFVSDPGRFGAG